MCSSIGKHVTTDLCTSGVCPVVPTGRSTVADCADKNPSCATWAANGECKNSAASWMADNCAKSCGVCTTAATLLSVPVTTAATVSGSECKDASDRCASWKSTGECTGTSGAFVRSMCPLSCGGCNSQRRSTHSLAEQRIAEALVATSTVQQLRQTFAPITLWGQSSDSSHSSVQLLTLAAVCLLSAWLSL